eukprot:scaffold576_cov260-Pinguiococcus_pyrenoidosus.AAC.73
MVSLVGADELIQGGLGGAHFLGNEPDLAGAGLLDHVEILRRDEHKLLVGMLPRHVQERLHALLPRDGVHEHVELIHEAEGTFDDSPEANQKGERGVAAFSPGKQADIGDLRLGISLILLHLDAQLFRVILQLDLSGVPLLVQDAVERSVGLLLHKGAHALPRSLPRFDVVLQVGHGKLDVANRVARIVEDLKKRRRESGHERRPWTFVHPHPDPKPNRTFLWCSYLCRSSPKFAFERPFFLISCVARTGA